MSGFWQWMSFCFFTTIHKEQHQRTKMKSSATANNTMNTFHKVTKATKITKVDGLDTPYPPSAPAYCTRSSLKEMEDTSKSLTERELHKLQAQTKSNSLPNYTTDVKCVPAIEFNPDMHRIMCKYADKQQQLCSQNFELTKRLQAKHDEVMKLKEEHEEELQSVRDDLSHMTEVNDGNEEEIDELTLLCQTHETSIESLEQRIANTQYWYPFYVFLCIVVYTIGLFYTNHTLEWEMTTQYAMLHNTTRELMGYTFEMD